MVLVKAVENHDVRQCMWCKLTMNLPGYVDKQILSESDCSINDEQDQPSSLIWIDIKVMVRKYMEYQYLWGNNRHEVKNMHGRWFQMENDESVNYKHSAMYELLGHSKKRKSSIDFWIWCPMVVQQSIILYASAINDWENNQFESIVVLCLLLTWFWFWWQSFGALEILQTLTWKQF
jgi:hypothetical protein